MIVAYTIKLKAIFLVRTCIFTALIVANYLSLDRYRLTAMYKKLCLFLPAITIFTIVPFMVFAQKDSLLLKHKIQKEFAAHFHYGSIYAHSQDIKNTADASPYGISLEFSKRSVDAQSWNNYGCYTRTGFMLSYLNFNTPILGRSYTAAFIFEPTYRLNDRMDFIIRTRVGLSYMTNPHDSLKNPDNKTYSTYIDFYTSLGVGVSYKVSPHYSAVIAANFIHNSNGGFKEPNRGMNYPGFSVGLVYSMDSNVTPHFKRVKNYDWKADRTKFDLAAYYSPKEGYNSQWGSVRKFLFGFEGQMSYRVSSINALTGGAEIYYDAAIKTIKHNIGDSSSNIFSGLLIGNEFIFGKILFSQQLGFYIYKNTESYQNYYRPEFAGVYHRWGLRYKVKEHWYVGFNILVHGHVADFIDGRVVYRF